MSRIAPRRRHACGGTLCSRNPHEWQALFLDYPGTHIVSYVGEIGGWKEYAMLEPISSARKPVSLVVGRYAPAAKKGGLPARSSEAPVKQLRPGMPRFAKPALMSPPPRFIFPTS